jgi:hypothetical protein
MEEAAGTASRRRSRTIATPMPFNSNSERYEKRLFEKSAMKSNTGTAYRTEIPRTSAARRAAAYPSSSHRSNGPLLEATAPRSPPIDWPAPWPSASSKTLPTRYSMATADSETMAIAPIAARARARYRVKYRSRRRKVFTSAGP